MAENKKIQWATHTVNPWRGCTKVAAGCANCYADSQAKRNPKTLGIWGEHGTRVVASEAMWRKPVRWNREIQLNLDASVDCYYDSPLKQRYERPRVFCASMCDVFEDWEGQCKMSDGGWCIQHRQWGKPTGFGTCNLSGGSDAVKLDDVRRRLFTLIDDTPNLDWLLLTKRPENIRRMWCALDDTIYAGINGDDESTIPLPMDQYPAPRRPNVWLGCSVSNQDDADRNIPELLRCRDLAPVLFLSIEPLVGDVDLAHWIRPIGDGLTHNKGIDWIIVGGESGPNARPCRDEWIRSIVKQCQDAGVPCFVKQMGSNLIHRDGKQYRWTHPKGGDPSEWTYDLRVRQFPKVVPA